MPWEILLSLANLGLVALAVYCTAHHFKKTRASSYLERFNDPSTLNSRALVDRWLSTHPTNTERLLALDSDPELASAVKYFANLFQELGVAYREGVVCRSTVADTFDTLVIIYWEKLRFWVADHRLRLSPTLYSSFEQLYKAMLQKQRSAPARAIYVFGYGSLMHPVSASAPLLQRTLDLGEMVPAVLAGYRRSWSAVDTVYAEERGETVDALFLDLAPSPQGTVTGVLFRVSEQELARLQAREKSYALLDVSDRVRPLSQAALHPSVEVFTFISRPECRPVTEGRGYVVMRNYLAKLEEALAVHGEAFRQRYDASTEAPQARIQTGSYRFTDPLQAELV